MSSNDNVFISFGKYAVAGTIAVTVTYIILMTLVEFADVDPTLSSAIGFLLGTAVNYTLQYYWTFRATKKHAHVLPKYALVTAVTLLLNIILFWSLTNTFEIWYIYSQAITLIIISIINFLINRVFIFL